MSEYAKNIQTIEDMWKKRIELREGGGGRMSELKQLYVPTPTTEEYGGFKVTKEYVPMDEFERGIKTADMVSVVRCRDCKYYIKDPDPIDPGWPMMCADSGRDMLEPDGFCAWGECEDGDAR